MNRGRQDLSMTILRWTLNWTTGANLKDRDGDSN